MGKIFEFLREYGLALLVGAVGLSCFGYGLWQVVVPEQIAVEIAQGDKSSEHSLAQSSELGGELVDVAGAVVNPGIYKLPSGARVGEALVAAGGLAADADREWVAATLNLAEAVTDGEKIYVPANQQILRQAQDMVGESASQQDQQISASAGQKSAKVNINTASEAELDTLWGIGPSRATAIIAGRPYAATDEIIAKAGIPQSVYDRIKDGITVY